MLAYLKVVYLVNCLCKCADVNPLVAYEHESADASKGNRCQLLLAPVTKLYIPALRVLNITKRSQFKCP